MKRSIVMGLAISVAIVCQGLLSGCEEKSAAKESTTGPASDRPADQPSVFASYKTHFDLWEHAHLAEIDHQGLYIEFGQPTRPKYTYGDWRSGWGKDGAQGAEAYTVANADASRVYFAWPDGGAATMRLRLKPIGTGLVTPYLNGEALPVVRFEGNQFQDYDVAIPAGRLQPGENRLMLRFGGTTLVNGEPTAVHMASLRLAPGELGKAGSDFSPPRLADLRTEVAVGGTQRRALAVRPPTTLTYYVDVPVGAKLGFGVGVAGGEAAAVKASVNVTAEGGAAKQLWAGDLQGRWQDQVLPLDDFAGKLVRIDLTAAGSVGVGRVGWSTPAILLPNQAPPQPKKQAKNVVVLLIDTMRARSLRPYNDATRVKTPVIDQVAKEGLVFEAAQAPENWTKPSVASVLTGLFPSTHGAKTDGAMVPKGATLLSEAFKEAGFTTASFLANGYVSDKFGFKQGWDHYTNYIREKKSTEAETVFKEAGDWIEAHKGERFFTYVQTIDPHVPYDPGDKFLGLYRNSGYSGQVSPRRTAELLAGAKHNPPQVVFTEGDKQYLRDLYDGEVSYHDHYLGLFLERLKSLGVYDDTLFVITSDHGEEFDEHGSWGHGHSVYQELLWVPYIVRFPGVVPAGRRIARSVSTMTIYPTVLEAAGVQVPPAVEAESVLTEMMGGPPPAVPVAFSDFLDDRRVIRAGPYKLILRGINETMFDLAKDPLEQRELGRGNLRVAARYMTMLLGQLLGAKDLRHWLSGGQQDGVRFQRENADIDKTLREQLEALGYAGDEPAADTH